MLAATVQLFASYAELLGARQITIEMSDEATVGDLVASIRTLPAATALPANPLVAINHRFARYEQTIGKNDEIALIPPVAGG